MEEFVQIFAQTLGIQTQEQLQQALQSFAEWFAYATGISSQEEFQSAIENMSVEEQQSAIQQFQEFRVQSARWGAKLNYIKSLRGVCPDGYELRYFKKGGKLCKKCVAKAKKQAKVKKQVKGDTVDDFKKEYREAMIQAKDGGGNLEPASNQKDRNKIRPGSVVDQDEEYRNAKDQAARDSILINKYNDQELQVFAPGEYVKMPDGRIIWVPYRNDPYYNTIPVREQTGD